MYRVLDIIPGDLIEDVLSYGDTARQYRVGVVSGGGNVYDPSKRSTTGVRIDPTLYPEITELLESLVDDDTVVNQFDFLIYNKGDFFGRHRDIFKEPEREDYRIWTTITVLDLSDDLQGGQLCIDDNDPISLQVGETVIFKSDVYHEALEVLQGTRKVLVAWLGKYKYD